MFNINKISSTSTSHLLWRMDQSSSFLSLNDLFWNKGTISHKCIYFVAVRQTDMPKATKQ